TTFADKTNDDRAFIAHLWARRKVGYMLDQIRANGEKKELIDEIVFLAKKYGITTPYTSHLIVPEGALPVAGRQGGKVPLVVSAGPAVAPGLVNKDASKKPEAAWEYAKRMQQEPGDLVANRSKLQDDQLSKAEKGETEQARQNRMATQG